jgi:hypothetical protein
MPRLMRLVLRGMAVAALAGLVMACASSPAAREAARLAWDDRDSERAQECARLGGRWLTEGCSYRCD